MPEPNQLTDREIELIHLFVKGEATARQRVEVSVLLSRSEAARNFHELISDVAEGLDPAPLAPSAEVRDEIVSGPRTGFPFSTAGHAGGVVLAGAWAVAAALFIGLAADRWLGSDERISPAQAAASMSPAERETWPLLNEIESEAATLIVRGDGDRYALEVVPHRPGQVSIRWDEQKLTGSGEASFPFDTATPAVVVHRRGHAAGSAAVTVLIEGQPAVHSSIPSVLEPTA